MSFAAALLLAVPAAPSVPVFTGFRAVPFAPSRIGHLLIKGELNGKPVDILLDSGSSRTVIDRGWAARNGLAVIALNEKAYGAGGSLPLGVVRGARVSLGGATLAQTPIYAIDLSSVISGLDKLGAAAPQMILGGDILKRHRALIDYGTNRLWLAQAR